MGGCFSFSSDPERQIDRDIARDVRRDKEQASRVKKILFLGSGGSGKSTIFKQLREIYGEPLTRLERRQYVQYIHEQCIMQMRQALEMLRDFQDESNLQHKQMAENYDLYYANEEKDDGQGFGIPDLSEQGVEAADIIQSLHHTKYRLTDEVVAAIKILWDEPAIRKMYELRNITGIEDSSSYFWNNLDVIAERDYIPDSADVLLVRKRTTGVNESEYEIKDTKGNNKGIFKIVDVGGQKSERRKWIHSFDSVTAVIFVASLSCYDEVTFEAMDINSMTDQLDLFNNVINDKSLAKTSMILFLNKKDLFNTKIEKVPLNICKSFSRYDGEPHSFDQTTKYIRKAFTSLNENAQTRNIFTHVTCATDVDNIQKVFADVQHIVIEASLIQAGLMDWDDEQKYQQRTSGGGHTDTNDENGDPSTGAHIRNEIEKQNAKKNRRRSDLDLTLSSNAGAFPSHARSISANNFDFRERIKRDSIPHIRSIDTLSVLPQYKYSNGRNEESFTNLESLLRGKYSWAISSVPPSVHSNAASSPSKSKVIAIGGGSSTTSATVEEKEMYLMVDIAPDPVVAGSNVRRRRINLAVVLDVGQSMSRLFVDTSMKLDECKKMIMELLKNELSDDDRFALIWFDDIAKVFQAMVEVKKRNLAELSKQIVNIRPSQHSLMSPRADTAGFDLAVQEFRKLFNKQKEALQDCENRVIVISALPLSDKTIQSMKDAAGATEIEKRVYSTFICNRNDRQENWVQVQNQRESVYKIAGCNYFTLNSREQLKDRLVTRFEETVTPLMFKLSVTLEVPSSNEECIDSVVRLNVEEDSTERLQRLRGRRDAGDLTKRNEMLSIDTLFPDPKDIDKLEGSTRFKYNFRNHHYVLLVKLKAEVLGQREFKIVQRYENGNGEAVTVDNTISLQMSPNSEDSEYQGSPSTEPMLPTNGASGGSIEEDRDYYDNVSIRKAIVLSRYIRMLRDWVENDNDRKKSATKLDTAKRKGSIVSKEFQGRFEQFAGYFESEIKVINDDQLTRDLGVIEHLFNRKS